MKELAEELEKNISLGENTEKYIAFTVPIKKEVKSIFKKGEKITKNILNVTIYWQHKIYGKHIIKSCK